MILVIYTVHDYEAEPILVDPEKLNPENLVDKALINAKKTHGFYHACLEAECDGDYPSISEAAICKLKMPATIDKVVMMKVMCE